MNVKDYIEGDTVNVDWVKGLKSLIVVVTQPGEENKQFSKPQIFIEHETKGKYWILNKKTLVNLSKEWGMNTEEWVGKKVRLEVQDMRGRDAVIGYPYYDPVEKNAI